MVLLAADASRPRFALPRAPSKVDIKPEVQTPRSYAERRSTTPSQRGMEPTEPSGVAVSSMHADPPAATRSNSVSSAQTGPSRTSSRPRYSEVRKARRASAQPEVQPEVSCASSVISAGEPRPRPRPEAQAATAPTAATAPMAMAQTFPGVLPEGDLTPRTRSRYSELRKSRSPRPQPVAEPAFAPEPSEGTTAGRSPTTPLASERPEPKPEPKPSSGADLAEVFRRLENLECETMSLAGQVSDLKALNRHDIQLIRDESRQQAEACERLCRLSCRDEGRRQLEACEDQLRQFQEENRKQLESAQSRIFASAARQIF
ncbi:unnamed protein product [Effrenium voratum]|nr:unnamed protein product [Effrenium voratum]